MNRTPQSGGMYSWKSRFRKTKTPDVAEIKPSSNISKNVDDTEQQKNRISRFLRRTKHENETNDRPRPRSVFLERNATDFNGNQKPALSPRNLGDPPSVQEILDRNRRERAAGKSPRPWRKFLTGDRSPSGNRHRDSGNVEKDDYSYRSKHRDGNKTFDAEKYETSSQVSNDSDKYSRRERHSEDGTRRKSGIVESRKARKASTDGSLRSGSDNSSEKAKDRSRSASPYDNVDEGFKRRRERRSHSLYIESRSSDSQRDSEMSSIGEKSATPGSKRRDRMRRSDSQDTVSSERSVRGKTLIEKEIYVSRRPQTYYTGRDDNEDTWKPRSHFEDDKGSGRRDWKYRNQSESKVGDTMDENLNQNERNRDKKSPRIYRKLSDGKKSEYTTDQSLKDGEKVSRVFEKGSYGKRSSENILGATLNYIERKPSHDYLSTATTKIIEEFNDSPRERRRRMRGVRDDKLFDNGPIPDFDCESSSGSTRRKYSYTSTIATYKTSTEATAYKSTTGRRESHGRVRPKSLYDFHENTSYTDGLSKFQEDGSSSHTERYRSRNDYKAKDEEKSKWRRPKTLFMIENEKKESAYRGNWSVNVPKRPDHLKDFSKPDETSTGYNWRKDRREKQDEIVSSSMVGDTDRDEIRRDRIPLKERTGGRTDDKVSSYSWRKSRKEKDEDEGSNCAGSKRFENDREVKEKDAIKDNKDDTNTKGERISYIRRQSQQAMRDSEEKPEIQVPAFEFTVSQPKDEDVRSKDTKKEENKMSTLGEDTVVRRRRREHAPPARPSSIYHVKKEEQSSDPISVNREEKTADGREEEEYDSKYRSRRRPHVNLDSEDIKAGLRKKSAVERRLRNKYTKERPKSVNLADVFSVSNDRSSSYLTKVKIHDPLRDTVDDVKREFDKLLRRTEDWKLRTESLNSKATVLSSSYRSLNKAITGIRDESDDMYAVIENIGERLTANDSIGYPDTEEEWRRAFEGGKLVEKALRSLEYQKRNPKPEFEYSDSESEPSTPDESFYDMPEGIPWFSRRTSRENSSSRLYSLTDQYSSRKTSDFNDGNTKGYTSYRPSLDVISNLAVSTSARFPQSYVSDVYTRRSRYQDSFIDYKGTSGGFSVSSSSNGRIIPETAV